MHRIFQAPFQTESITHLSDNYELLGAPHPGPDSVVINRLIRTCEKGLRKGLKTLDKNPKFLYLTLRNKSIQHSGMFWASQKRVLANLQIRIPA